MRTGRLFNLEKRVLSLEFRIRNLEFAHRWFEELRANADEFEVAEYDAALAKNQSAIGALRGELTQTRRQLRGGSRAPTAEKVAA